VTQAELGQLGGPDFTVTLTWTPQRAIWLALGISGVTLVFCLLIGFLPSGWRSGIRRRLPGWLRRVAGTSRPADPPPNEDGSGARGGSLPVWWKAVLIGLVTGAAAAGVTSPGAGALVAVMVALGIRLPWARWAVTLGAVAAIVTGCLDVIVGQSTHHYLPGANWAAAFIHAGNLIWFGVVLLVADAVIVAARSRQALRATAARLKADEQPPAPGPPTTVEPSPPT
jgi:hypothetical protein